MVLVKIIYQTLKVFAQNTQFIYVFRKLTNIFHKSLPLDPILSQFSPVYFFTPCFLKVNFNIILPSAHRALMWSPSLRFSD
jgi:hypothetical protein